MRRALPPSPVRRTLVGVLAATLLVQLLVISSGLACMGAAGTFMLPAVATLGAAPDAPAAAVHGPAAQDMANHPASEQGDAGRPPHGQSAPCGMPGSPGHCGAFHGCSVQMVAAVALVTGEQPADALPPATMAHAVVRDAAQPEAPPPRLRSASGAL